MIKHLSFVERFVRDGFIRPRNSEDIFHRAGDVIDLHRRSFCGLALVIWAR
jgi:hypothetical protein